MENYVSSSGVYIGYLVKSLTIIVCLLAFFFYWYKYWLPKMQNNGTGNLRLHERLVIEPGTSAYVLEIQGEFKLLIVSNKQTGCYDLATRTLSLSKRPMKREYPSTGSGYVARYSKKDFAAYLKEITAKFGKKAKKAGKQK